MLGAHRPPTWGDVADTITTHRSLMGTHCVGASVPKRMVALAGLASVLLAVLVASPTVARADDPPAVGTVTRFTDDVLETPLGIAAGPDGNMWFAAVDAIQRITPTGEVTTFPVADAGPFMITAGPDGNLWFTAYDNKIGRITPAGVVTLFPVFSNGDGQQNQLWDIVAGPDGNLWFTAPNRGVLGRITTSGVVTTFSSSRMVGTHALTVGRDGNLWFSYRRPQEPDGTTGIGSMTTQGAFSFLDEAHLRSQGVVGALALTLGPDGNLWAADFFGISRISASGVVAKFPFGDNKAPWDITTGPDGNIWFVPLDSSQVVRMTPAGSMTRFPATDDDTMSSSSVNGIAPGPDGTIWFTNSGSPESSGERVGMISSVVSGSLPTCSEPPFSDVSTSHVFCGQIAWMVDEGIATGFSDGTFRPASVVSRQAAVAFLYRLAGSPDGEEPVCSQAPFSDVPVGHRFCGEIAWAAAEGIAFGHLDGSFRPSVPVARQASAAFLYRFEGRPDGVRPACAAAPFSDVPKAHAFCGEIAWAARSGITNGFGDGSFRPTISVSRQAMATFLYRLDNTQI